MNSMSVRSILDCLRHVQPCRIWRTYASKLLEWRITGTFCTTKALTHNTRCSKLRYASSLLSYRRYPQHFFSEPKTPFCTSNATSSGFHTTNHTKTEQTYPDEEESENLKNCSDPESQDWDKEVYADDVEMLEDVRNNHNHIRVLEVSRRADHPLAGARLLLLDKPGNIHSMYFKYKILTNSYYDVFGTLPPVVPDGTLGILGMGAGTAAHILLHFWPSVEIQGWEIDPMVISMGRKYFDILELERNNVGNFAIHVGDALEANVEGGFSGFIVDLFAQGSLIPELQSSRTWECLKGRLRDGGRIMVNCGGGSVEAERSSRDGHMVMQETLAALGEVFPDEVFVLRLEKEDTSIALTGPLPDFDDWRQALPSCLRIYADKSKWVSVSDFI